MGLQAHPHFSVVPANLTGPGSIPEAPGTPRTKVLPFPMGLKPGDKGVQ